MEAIQFWKGNPVIKPWLFNFGYLLMVKGRDVSHLHGLFQSQPGKLACNIWSFSLCLSHICHKLYWQPWAALLNATIPDVIFSCWHKYVVGMIWLTEHHLSCVSYICVLCHGAPIRLTSPSVDCKCSSFLQVAFKSPAAALTCIPLGASIIKDLVGDSSLKVCFWKKGERGGKS